MDNDKSDPTEALRARAEQLRQENLAQWEEAQSSANAWYASQALGREATPWERFLHYVQHGGAAAFRERQTCRPP
jgi:hypothetical protein